jgi:hypothetical protein
MSTLLTHPPIAPALSMADVYGPNHVYAPRAHGGRCRWLTEDPSILDALTANQLCVAGTMPVVCSAGAVTPAGLELLSEAGMVVATTKLVYHSPDDAFHRARDLAMRDGARLVLQHVYPDGALPAGSTWVEPELLSYLNNKANLGAIVADPYIVPRRVVIDGGVTGALSTLSLPCVVKVASDDSNGGGVAVAMCREPVDLVAASERFASCERLVVEEMLDVDRSPCLHFAVLPDGRVRYLGFADQDVTPAGRYRGNWLTNDPGSALAPEAVVSATTAVHRAADMGFRGIAGIDLAILRSGRSLVIDLNFRVNGSTAAVLLAGAIDEATMPGVTMHLRTFLGRAGAPAGDLFRAVRAAVRAGRLVPLATFDPIAAGYTPDSGATARVAGIVLGDGRDDCLAYEADLATRGVI